MKKLVFCAALIAAAFDSAQAQKVIVFESTSGNDHYHRSRRQEEDNGKNSLTLGMLSWFNGYVPVYYERKVTGFLSIQAGAGITMRSYGNDFGQIMYEDGNRSDKFGGVGYTDVQDHYEYYANRKAKAGYFLSLAPKVYFRDNCMNGFFLSPAVAYKRFNYTARLADATPQAGDLYYEYGDERDIPRSSQWTNEYMNCLDVTVNIGGHYQASNHLAFAWDIGFGMRHLSASRLDLGYTYDSNNSQYSYVNNMRSYSAVRPVIIFDFRIGGWF